MAVIMGFFIVFLGMSFAGLVFYISSLIQDRESPELIPLQLEHLKENKVERKLYYALAINGYMAYSRYKVGKYRSDLFISPNILIDLGGNAGHLDNGRKKRNSYLQKRGYKVITFNRPRINRDINGLIQRIEKELNIQKINHQ